MTIMNRSIDTWNIVLMADRTVEEFVDQLVIGNRKSITLSKSKFSLKRYIIYFTMQHDTSKELLRLYTKLSKEITQKTSYTEEEFDAMVARITVAFGTSLLLSKAMSMSLGQLMYSPIRKKKLDAEYALLTSKIKDKVCSLEDLYAGALLCKLASPLFVQLARASDAQPRRRYSRAYHHFLQKIYPTVLSTINEITAHYILEYYMPPYTGPIINMAPDKLLAYVRDSGVIPTAIAELDLALNVLNEIKICVIRSLRGVSQPRQMMVKPTRFKLNYTLARQ
jgi:hypothetical protein